MIVQIRQELRRLFGLLKHAETATEEVIRERVANLHNNLEAAEAHLVTVPAVVLRELRNLATAASAETLKTVDAVLQAAADKQAEIEAAAAKVSAERNAAAARVALKVPEAKAELPSAPPADPAPAPAA